MLILFSFIWHLLLKKTTFLHTYLSDYSIFNEYETFDVLKKQ